VIGLPDWSAEYEYVAGAGKLPDMYPEGDLNESGD